jgi:histidine triad (HIT) family protein
MATDANCLFCKIVAGDVPADVVHETDRTVAFRDIEAQAPTHVLVIPRNHEPDAAALAAADPESMVELMTTAGAVAEKEGLDEGYRMVFNTGAQAQQTVFHAHLHVIGGRPMTWPPG